MRILEISNLSIRYMTGDFKEIGLKEYIIRKRKRNYCVTEFWADRNITFTLEEGDMLGIIGTNGAGKSTLLKAISGIMEPTKGYVKRQGNIAALLELGSGFDRDLTVRENTYLRGGMRGYTRRFMNETYDQIINFAERRAFGDRPFKPLSDLGDEAHTGLFHRQSGATRYPDFGQGFIRGGWGFSEKERGQNVGNHRKWCHDNVSQPLHCQVRELCLRSCGCTEGNNGNLTTM